VNVYNLLTHEQVARTIDRRPSGEAEQPLGEAQMNRYWDVIKGPVITGALTIKDEPESMGRTVMIGIC